jgi:hypothetical protein
MRQAYTADAFDTHVASPAHQAAQVLHTADLWPGKGARAYLADTPTLVLDFNECRPLVAVEHKPYWFVARNDPRIACLPCYTCVDDAFELMKHQVATGAHTVCSHHLLTLQMKGTHALALRQFTWPTGRPRRFQYCVVCFMCFEKKSQMRAHMKTLEHMRRRDRIDEHLLCKLIANDAADLSDAQRHHAHNLKRVALGKHYSKTVNKQLVRRIVQPTSIVELSPSAAVHSSPSVDSIEMSNDDELYNDEQLPDPATNVVASPNPERIRRAAPTRVTPRNTLDNPVQRLNELLDSTTGSRTLQALLGNQHVIAVSNVFDTTVASVIRHAPQHQSYNIRCASAEQLACCPSSAIDPHYWDTAEYPITPDNSQREWVWHGTDTPVWMCQPVTNLDAYYAQLNADRALDEQRRGCRTKNTLPTAISRYAGSLNVVAAAQSALPILLNAIPAAMQKELAMLCTELPPVFACSDGMFGVSSL